MGIVKGLVLAALSLYMLGALALVVFQRNMLFLGAADYQHDNQVLLLESQGERLNIIVLNPDQPKAIVYFGGNAEPVIFNEQPFTEHFTDHTVYLVNYRGYGGSSGSPSEEGLFADALALYDLIQEKHGSIVAIGRSLGTGVASYLAAKRELDALILITPYDSVKNVAQARFPIYPVSLMLRDHFDSLGRVKSIDEPTLVIMAELDQVIPNAHSQNLGRAFERRTVNNNRISIVKILGADHNNVSLAPNYYSSIKRFIENASQVMENTSQVMEIVP